MIHMLDTQILLCKGDSRSHTDNPDKAHARPLSNISYEDIINLARQPLQVQKDKCPFIIPVDTPTRIRKKILSGNFRAIVADIDQTKEDITSSNEMIKSILSCRGAFLVYTSRSATQTNQKYHLLIPTVPLTAYRWQVAMQVLNDKLTDSKITPDIACLNYTQAFYLPNEGEFYDYYNNEGDLFNPMASWNSEMLAKHKEIEEKERESRPPPTKNRSPEKTEGIIPTFNNTYTVQELLTQQGYKQQKGTNNFQHPNSSTATYSASVKNGKVFSLSTTDPLHSRHAHDPFNVFVILWHDGNHSEAMKDAGDNWLKVNGLSFNKHAQKTYMEGKK